MDDDGNDNMIHVTEDERVGDRSKNRPKLKSLPPISRSPGLSSREQIERREKIRRLLLESGKEYEREQAKRRKERREVREIRAAARQLGIKLPTRVDRSQEAQTQPQAAPLSVNFFGPITIVLGDMKR